MKTIHKHTFLIGDFSLSLPVDAQILKVDDQHERPTMWVLLDPEAPKIHRHFVVHGTGHKVKNDQRHCFTWLSGPFVWHLFEGNVSVHSYAESEQP